MRGREGRDRGREGWRGRERERGGRSDKLTSSPSLPPT